MFLLVYYQDGQWYMRADFGKFRIILISILKIEKKTYFLGHISTTKNLLQINTNVYSLKKLGRYKCKDIGKNASNELKWRSAERQEATQYKSKNNKSKHSHAHERIHKLHMHIYMCVCVHAGARKHSKKDTKPICAEKVLVALLSWWWWWQGSKQC